jgi:hypothetical protein
MILKARENTLYDVLQVKISHFTEPGQKTIREFVKKEVDSVELFPSENKDLSRMQIRFPGGMRWELYPGYWITRNPKNSTLEVLMPFDFNQKYEVIP